MEIETSSKFIISLPQTAIRLWGLESRNIGEIRLVETPLRTPQDISLADSNSEVNLWILGELGLESPQVIMKNELYKKTIADSYLDCNILNLSHHYSNLISVRDVKIIDYSSIGHRTLLWSDFVNLKDSLRAIHRNSKFKKKFSPQAIIHWDDYASERQNLLIDFTWSNIFVKTLRLKEKCTKFIYKHQSKIPEIRDISNDSKILLIAPHIKSQPSDVIANITHLVNSSEDAKKNFERSDYILIKHHRTSLAPFNKEFTVLGRKIRSLNSSISRAIPIEIYMHGFSSTSIFSAPSSSIYSHPSNFFLLEDQMSKEDRAEYGLMMSRHQEIRF